MVGIKYHRILKNVTQCELAEALHITPPTLMRYEHEDNKRSGTALMYKQISDYLGVPIDDLLKDYPDDLLDKRRYSKPEAPSTNCFGRYMQSNHYTLRSMAQVLGISHESVRLLKNSSEVDKKIIKTLAAKDNISIAKFMKIYGEC